MEIIATVVIVIFAIALLFGLRDWLGLFHWSWYENGRGFTIKLIILVLLFVTPALIKEFAPEYYGLSIWALILYSVGLLAHRLMTKGLDKEDSV